MGENKNIVFIIHYFRTFRIMRSLKLVTKFQKIQLVVLAITKAFKVHLISYYFVLCHISSIGFHIISLVWFKIG